MTEPLATSTDVVGRLGRALTTTEAARITALLLDASSAIVAYTGQTFVSEETTALLTVSNRRIRLPQQPVTAVASVLDQFDNAWPFTWIDGDSLLTLASSTWVNSWELNIYPWTRVGKMRVTYTHGYADIPDDIIGLVCQITARALGVPATDGGKTSETITNYSYTIGSAAAQGPFGLMADEKSVLDRYRVLAAPAAMM